MEKMFCEENFGCLGTKIHLKIIVNNEKERERAANALEEAKLRYYFYQKMLSRFDSESEVSKMNKKVGVWQTVSDEILHLAHASIEYNRETEGIFDPRIISVLENIGYDRDFSLVVANNLLKENFFVNFSRDLREEIVFREKRLKLSCRVDFTGIAKGYITDKIVNFFSEKGFKNFLVNSGGDLYICGKNIKGDDWATSLEGYPEDKFLIVASNKGIATSGMTKKRWSNKFGEVHHLIDTRNPHKFNFNLRTVTVIDDSVERADVWAKTLFILGVNKGLKKANSEDLSAIFLDVRGNITYSKKSKQFMKIIK